MANEARTLQAERDLLLRIVRQRLESLGRAGVAQVPAVGELPPAVPTASGPALPTHEPAPVVPPRPPAPEPRASIAPKDSPRAPALKLASSLFEEPALPPEAIPPSERPALLEVLRAEVAGCARCPHLAASRTQTVFGEGDPNARLMFIGEAPGADEDRTGRPFVGRAGVLLTDMITKGMGLRREDVYIANVLKSRPPENRTPEPPEIANCLPYLERQLEIIRPEYLCLLGKTAASALLETALPMGRLRGRWHRCRGIPAIVTYHPAYLLRTPSAKKEAWDDLQLLMQAMGLKRPGRS